MPTCKSCGAQVSGEARFCSFCGTEVPRPAERHVYVHHVREENQRGTFDVARRLEEVRNSPQFQQLMLHKPSTAGHAVGGAVAAVFGAIFAIIPLAGMNMMREGGRMFGEGPPVIFQIVPLIFVLIGLGVCVFGIVTLFRALGGEIVRRPALVLGESTSVSHSRDSDGHMHTHTSHHLALAFEDGTEDSFRASGKTLAMVDRGDAGVAYFLGKTLLEFRVVTRV
jgi:hypothetical protein